MGKVIAIAAVDDKFGIAKDGKIPWRVKEDQAWFKAVTTGNIVLMGSDTYFSFPKSVRPLPNRENWVLSRNSVDKVWQDARDAPAGLLISDSLEAMYESAVLLDATLFIGGGESVYEQVFTTMMLPDEVWLSRISGDFECDQFFLSDESRGTLNDFYVLGDEIEFNDFILEKYYFDLPTS